MSDAVGVWALAIFLIVIAVLASIDTFRMRKARRKAEDLLNVSNNRLRKTLSDKSRWN